MIRLVLRKAKSFMTVPLFVKLWLMPTWVILGFARLAVLCVPFRKIAKYLGEDFGTAATIPLLKPDQFSKAELVGKTVQLAARYAPWNANCFPQAIAAAALLKLYKIPYSIFFGLRKDMPSSESLAAHAWTMSGRVAVTGGRSFGKFTVVGVFTRWN